MGAVQGAFNQAIRPLGPIRRVGLTGIQPQGLTAERSKMILIQQVKICYHLGWSILSRTEIEFFITHFRRAAKDGYKNALLALGDSF